ncbi:MAG TPA: amino acid ABC transporter permease [Candidatus Desulfovibrio intestinipullorum]|uniref:Amino acid ABC transporter permease n=1 Tax=Candidatus Desulfovibrio intestinipullorum TaxID=2838536 RepID=A0A9D1PUT0_9BACT|nr:amino acid ABC transporter permease [Candidatus Desulfovibrio intestinipullorum]
MIEVISRTFTPEILMYLLGGAWLVIELSVIIVILSLFFGLILALLRSYDKFILGRLAGAYIEIFRNTPNLMWVLICYVHAPLPTAFMRCTFAFVLFTSAAIAEIIRGGLNSIPKGQFEAAYSQGFSFVQTLVYIVLPQCFQNIIPTLLSQVITVVKDTSFLSMVAVAELMFRSRNVLSLLPRYTGQTVGIEQVAAIFGFAALIYFIINFTLSCLVRYIQNRRAAKTRGRGEPAAAADKA